MNCVECRDHLVACAEGLLDGDEQAQCQAHLDNCARCQAEYQTVKGLQSSLIARGQAAAGVNLVDPVMNRLRQLEAERSTFLSVLWKHRRAIGLAAAAGIALILIFALLSMLNAKTKAVSDLTHGAQATAKLTSFLGLYPLKSNSNTAESKNKA